MNYMMKFDMCWTAESLCFGTDVSVSDHYITGTDIMGLLISVRPFHQVPANMDLYLLGVQE